MILNYHKIHTEHFIHVITMIEVNMSWKIFIVWISWFIAKLHLYIRKRFVHTLFPLSGSYSVFHISLLLLLGLLIQVYSILIVLSADGKRFWSPSKTVESNLVGFHVSHVFGPTWYLSWRKQRLITCELRQATTHYTWAWWLKQYLFIN